MRSTMPLRKRRARRSAQAGFSMIEILVTLLIMSLALMGVIGLQAQAMRLNQGGQFRAQAVFLAGDLAERIEANKDAAVAGDYEVATSSTPAAVTNLCVATNCTPHQLSDLDLSQWQAAIVASLPQPSWTVSQTGTNPRTYTIVISWTDRRSDTAYSTTATGETFSYTATRVVRQ